MNKLDLFKPAEEEFRVRGFIVGEAEWTTPLQRHVKWRLTRAGKLYFAKAAITGQEDLDEPNRRGGLQREVWWSHVIQKIRQMNLVFPFMSPRVIDSNTAAPLTADDIAWVITEYVQGEAIINWDLSDRTPWTDEQQRRFADFIQAVVRSLIALELITPQALIDKGLEPLPPFLPHGCRGSIDWWNRRLPLPRRLKNAITRWCEQRARERILAKPQNYILGNGACEVGNFHAVGQQVFVLDNEFAGFYDPLDALTYLFHRLSCNAMRPDLAITLLRSFFNARFQGTSKKQQDRFWRDFARGLRPRLLSGIYYDTVRRKLPLWHKKHRLRYRLLGRTLWRPRKLIS